MNFDREVLKGILPTLVMEVLAQRSMYGYELSKEMEKRSRAIFSLEKGTLYPLLYTLEAKGLVQGSREMGPTGRERKYYSLTTKGKTELAGGRRQLEELKRGLELFVKPRVSPA